MDVVDDAITVDGEPFDGGTRIEIDAFDPEAEDALIERINIAVASYIQEVDIIESATMNEDSVS